MSTRAAGCDTAADILRAIIRQCDDPAIRRWAQRLLRGQRAEGGGKAGVRDRHDVRAHHDERDKAQRRRGGGRGAKARHK
jgi:hypothetical protein